MAEEREEAARTSPAPVEKSNANGILEMASEGGEQDSGGASAASAPAAGVAGLGGASGAGCR